MKELNDKYKKEHTDLEESKGNIERLQEEIEKLEKEKEDTSVQVSTLCLVANNAGIDCATMYYLPRVHTYMHYLHVADALVYYVV